MKKLLENTLQRALRYNQEIQTRSVQPSQESVEKLNDLSTDLKEEGTSAQEVIEILDKYVSPATLGMSGPRFFGFVIGGSYPVATAANMLATSWDQNSAYYKTTPGTSKVENVALEWLVDLFGLPKGTGGAFVTGATVANFCALAAGRNAVLNKVGWNVEADGLQGAPTITVITGEEAHPTLFKSLGMLGLGRNRVVKVPVDDTGCFLADQLPQISGPTILCLQAGNIHTGAFDPFSEVIKKAQAAGAWVHVDGAFGLWARASSSKKGLANDIEKADSWATDGHKWLNVPYDSGITFVKEAKYLKAAMAITAEYLPESHDHRNPCDYTPELSRRARGVEVWAVLNHLGKSGVEELVDRACRHARRFGEAMTEAGYEVLNEVVLNQVMVSFGVAEFTERVIEAVQQDGTCWCGISHWQGNTVMRISVSGWSTTNEDVEKSIEAILRVANSTK